MNSMIIKWRNRHIPDVEFHTYRIDEDGVHHGQFIDGDKATDAVITGRELAEHWYKI